MIGLFDSGSGGLSVLRDLVRIAPNADIVYFGDIKNAPYGERSQTDLVELTKQGINLLRRRGAVEIVSACNSISPTFLAGTVGDGPMIEMTRPTTQMMRDYSGKKVLLMATTATMESRIYHDALANVVVLDTLPVPTLAGAIEFGRPELEIREIVHAALQSKKGATYDIILLGCTHYPLILPIIESEVSALFPEAKVIDPGEAVAKEVASHFDVSGHGRLEFYLSQDSSFFRKRVAELFPLKECTIAVL